MRAAVPTLENAVDPVRVGIPDPANGVLHGTTGRHTRILYSMTRHLFEPWINSADLRQSSVEHALL